MDAPHETSSKKMLETDVRTLIGSYGIKDVSMEVEKQCREAYVFLHKKFSSVQVAEKPVKSKKSTPLPLPAIEEIETVEAEEEVEEVVHLVVNEPSSAVAPTPDVKNVIITKAKGSDTVQQATPTAPVAAPNYNKTPEEVKQQKQQHREAVQARKVENESKGVKPESLLTKENLEKWLKSGFSYQKIAREYVGVHENQISAMATSFGLQSSVAKSNVMKRS